MPHIGVVVCGYGGIIGVRCQMGHLQRWGRGHRDGWFGRSRSRQEGQAVSHPQRIGKCRVAGMEAGMKGMISAACRELAGAQGAGTEGAQLWQQVCVG